MPKPFLRSGSRSQANRINRRICGALGNPETRVDGPDPKAM